ncbi:MAG: tetratricopeptide repeat protein [Saprospiraceae bacterium]|uniref:Tetratricopeptide repeat protein n=1 Tax=Candidatus Opimibacter skivensis TaxID=2982028 RepID=A0A9D7SV61_9BACT|nr:tetratricopeptide repeat protein [Candidatus Opimibacter skivensis]
MAKTIKKQEKKVMPGSFAGIPLHRIGPLLAILGTILYLQTVSFDYTQDDAIVINDNMYTTKGVDGIGGLLSHDTFYGYFKDASKTRLVSGGRYRPLTPIMFAFEYDIAGNHPWFSHLISAICYGLLCWVLFGFLRELLTPRLSPTIALQVAVIATLVFALHPIHTEVVGNIKGRDEIMAAMGSIGGLWLMLLSIKESKFWPYAGFAAVVFFLGLLSKENVITMLAVVPLTLWWYSKNKTISWVSAMIPIVVASGFFLLLRGSMTGWNKGETPKELMNNPFLKIENNVYVPFSFGEKTATITYTMGKYVQLLLFPYPLTHDYYPRHIEIQDWGKPLVLLSLLMWLALFWIVIKGWKTRSWWAYGILFYVFTMSITSNLVFPVGTNMSERFAFLPSVGFAIIVGLGLSMLLDSKYRKMGIVLATIVLVAYGGWTAARSRVWKDNHTLFTTDIKTSARSAKLLNAVGGDLVTLSESEKNEDVKRKELTDAQMYLNRALEIHPNYKLSYLLLGNSYYHLGDFDKAITYYRQVLKIDPDYTEGKRNLGVALRDEGKNQGEKLNNLTGAISLLEEALSYLPDDFTTYHLLGVAYGQKGETMKAITFFKKEIELAPKNAAAYFNLGIAYQHAGDEANAKISFDKAKEIDPNLPQLKGK